jgi:CheY-like chemotaxis protein
VFDPFFTTKSPDKGTGLGLSQVHGFAHQSGGTVTVESEVGRGTLVTIYLPRSMESPHAGSPQAEIENGAWGRILLVEDNPEVREVTTGMIEQLGYETQGAADADGALTAIAEQDFDLVISDIVMPGSMDGTALANAIRARKPSLPVLLMTGYRPAAPRIDGAFAVIRKPFQLSDLSLMITRLIAEAKQPPDSNVVRLHDARR